MNNSIMSAAEMVTLTFKNIESSSLESTNKVNDSWKKILTSIKSWDEDNNLGQNLYEHSSVVEIKNNILLVEADHNGWLQMLQMHKKYILNGLKMYVPELQIVSLAFRLRGSNATLSNVDYNSAYKEESQTMKKKLENEENILRKYEKNDEKHSGDNSLPSELVKIFENMSKTANQ